MAVFLWSTLVKFACLGLVLAASIVGKGKDRPRNVTLEAYNSTVLVARWQHPVSARECPITRYIVRLKSDGRDGSSSDRLLGNATTAVLKEMRADTKYMVRIVAVSCRGKSIPTRWVRTRTPALPSKIGQRRTRRTESAMPGKPTRVRTRTFTDSIIINWEPPTDEVLVRGYMVGYGEGVPDVNWQYVDAQTRTFTIQNLKSASQYVISLRAYNNFAQGPVVYDLIYTREEMGPTPGPLSAPIGLRSRILSPRTAWLEWTDNSLGRPQKITDDRYYTVTYSVMPVGASHTLTVKSLNVVFYDLTPATTYEFRVKTRKGTEETPFGISVYNTTFEDVPDSAPRSLSVIPSNTSVTSVSVSWLPPEQPNGVVTGYLIFYAPLEEDETLQDWTIEGVLGDVFHITMEGFQPDVTYDFKIQARNAQGYGPTSPVVTYQRQALHGPDSPPGNLHVSPSNTSRTAVIVSWEPAQQDGNDTAIQYAISHQKAKKDGSISEIWTIARASGDVTQLVLEGFRPDVTYNFKIQSRKSGRYGHASPVVVYRRDPVQEGFKLENVPLFADDYDAYYDDEETKREPESAKPRRELDNNTLLPAAYRSVDTRKILADMQASSAASTSSPHSGKTTAIYIDLPKSDDHHTDEDTAHQGLSAPASLRTLVRHRVSAVITWDNEDHGKSQDQPVRYEIKYYQEGQGHHVMSLRSHVPIFLLDNLLPGTEYMYNVTMQDTNTNSMLWFKTGDFSTRRRH